MLGYLILERLNTWADRLHANPGFHSDSYHDLVHFQLPSPRIHPSHALHQQSLKVDQVFDTSRTEKNHL